MKKILLRIFSILIVAVTALLIALMIYGTRKLTNFEKVTFNKILVTEHDHFSKHYGIGNARNPADYGYPDFTEHTYLSEQDGVKLHAWHVPAKNESNRCIVLLHGRGANKLRTMKYLSLVKELGMDRDYSVLIPDLRNSGMSESARSSLGYDFAEDIFSTLKYGKKTFGTDSYILYGFSMGAMGIQLMLYRDDLKEAMGKEGMSIEKIIFDSPVTNNDRLVMERTEKRNMPAIVGHIGLAGFDIKSCFFLPRMRLCTLYKDIDIPLLILQAKDDPTCTLKTLQGELECLDGKNKSIQVKLFRTGNHVRIYQNEEMRAEYIQTVRQFLGR
jgi:alpha-beta hydrolase superfamily lysophospholipase